jgi:hypothetical protein
MISHTEVVVKKLICFTHFVMYIAYKPNISEEVSYIVKKESSRFVHKVMFRFEFDFKFFILFTSKLKFGIFLNSVTIFN